MCGLLGKVDNARLKVEGDVLAINLRELKAIAGLRQPATDAMVTKSKLEANEYVKVKVTDTSIKSSLVQ